MFKLLVLLPFIGSLIGSALGAPVAATATVNPADDSGAAIASAAVAAAAAAATQTVPVIPAGDGASTANIAAIPLPAIPVSFTGPFSSYFINVELPHSAPAFLSPAKVIPMLRCLR
jgi:hypothetical protein